MTNPENNPIGFLQEICQKHCYRFPQYEEINSSGPDHCREFTVICKFEGFEALGLSRQKKQAKSEAAKAMIALLKQNDSFDKLKLTNELSNTRNIDNEDNDGVMSENNLSFSESKNPISAINEFCHKTSLPPPQFVETSAGGVFICECRLKDKKTYGHGSNKKTAKTDAALKMCLAFNMKCSGVGYLLKEANLLREQMEDDFQLQKHPVSALQELCAQNPSGKTPEYTEMPSIMNLFVIKCTYKSVSCEGRGTSKKFAKTEAARQVLLKLLAQSENPEGQVPAISGLSKVLNSGGISDVSPPGVQEGELLEFRIDSSEDECEEDKNNKHNAVDVNLSLNLEALSLDPEHDVQDISDRKSGETNEAQEEPVKSSSESSILS